MKQVHYCKGGKPIDDARVNKYDAMCHHMVRKFLPALALFEASMDYDDLVNQCRYEVFMALKNKFDPALAMTSTISDPVKRAEQIAKKQADPEWALAQAEKAIVYGRLENYLRRTRHNFHPDTLLGRDVKPFRCPSCGHTERHSKKALKAGGKKVIPPTCPRHDIQMREEQDMGGCSVSLDMIMEGVNREEDNNLFVDPKQLEDIRAIADREELMRVMDEKGPEAAKSLFDSMDEERKDALKSLLVGEPTSEAAGLGDGTESEEL
jgi:hypothetical protein